MKKKILLRGFFGFPIGVTSGYFITIVLSLILAGGYYSPCVPDLITIMGSEIYAVLIQALLCGLLGTGFAMASVIWEIERWGIVKQTGIYFIIISVIMMPIAWITCWMEHSITGVLKYFGIFALIFVLIWIIQFFRGKNDVRKMNENLDKTKYHNMK